MQIAIYANELIRPGKRGVKTYSEEIIRSLLALDSKNKYSLYANGDLGQEWGALGAQVVADLPLKRFWAYACFPKLIRRDRPDVVFVPIQIFPFLHLLRNKPKFVVTVHDVAFLPFPEQFAFVRRKLLELHTWWAVKGADWIIVPSEATKSDLVHYYHLIPEKIAVVPHGYSKKLAELAESRDGVVKMFPYVLFVGTVSPRKNLQRLVEAFETVKKEPDAAELKLVVCGAKGWKYEEILERIKKSPVAADIVLTGEVDDATLAGLYRNALVFAQVSLSEGFGLPVLEAMSFGLPVVCGNNSALCEIAGEAGLLVNAENVADIAEKLKTLILSQEQRADLSGKSLRRSQDFGWEKSAAMTLSVLERVIEA